MVNFYESTKTHSLSIEELAKWNALRRTTTPCKSQMSLCLCAWAAHFTHRCNHSVGLIQRSSCSGCNWAKCIPFMDYGIRRTMQNCVYTQPTCSPISFFKYSISCKTIDERDRTTVRYFLLNANIMVQWCCLSDAMPGIVVRIANVLFIRCVRKQKPQNHRWNNFA